MSCRAFPRILRRSLAMVALLIAAPAFGAAQQPAVDPAASRLGAVRWAVTPLPAAPSTARPAPALATGAQRFELAASSGAVFSRSASHRLSRPAPGGSYLWIGAAIGLVVGAAASWAVLESGGSTSLCDQRANQDAMSAGECAALTAAGGLAGAAIGAFIGSRLRR